MNEVECVARFGLVPRPEDLAAIRRELTSQAHLEKKSQGRGDTQVMRFLCYLLFRTLDTSEILMIWEAKTSSMDADASIDLQLLCGPGITRSKEYLASLSSAPDASAQAQAQARAALGELAVAEETGDFDDFSPEDFALDLEDYYRSLGKDEG